MNPTLKKVLQVGAAIVIPGAMVFMIVKSIAEEIDKAHFREYVRKTYGKGSNYEHVERY